MLLSSVNLSSTAAFKLFSVVHVGGGEEENIRLYIKQSNQII